MKRLNKVLFCITCAGFICLSGLDGIASDIKIDSAGISMRATASGAVSVLTEKGNSLITISGINLAWKPHFTFTSVSARRFVDSDAAMGIEVDYEVQKSDASFTPTVKGRYVIRPHRVDVRFDITGVPTNQVVNWGGCMMKRTRGKGIVQTRVVRTTNWRRDENGGVPVEETGRNVIDFSSANGGFFFVCGEGCNANPQWADTWAQHVALRRCSNGDFYTTFSIVVPQEGWTAERVAAQCEGRPFNLSLSTDRVYNWWQNVSEPLAVSVQIANTSDLPREAIVSHWVRAFDGTIVSQGQRRKMFQPYESDTELISFLSKRERDIFFVEASVMDAKTHEEVFRRTNLALLPPHTFRSTPQNSVFGLAAYWPLPTEDDAQRLMDRMGVKWLRVGNTHQQSGGRISIHHSNIKWSKAWTDSERDEWIRKQFEQCVKKGNPYWEFANEINMSTLGIAMEGGGIGKAALAEPYIDWLKAIRRVQKEDGFENVKVLSFGLAGMDTVFVDRIHALGGWELLDGFCLHPGRGNFAVDYPIRTPERNEDPYSDKLEVGPHSNYWNFLGSVRKAKNRIQRYGTMPLWLTEVYAPTYPNSFWEDTMRGAAENTLLTYALIKAEGVKCGMWYQLFDSVWYDRQGANPKDREYYFGLAQRDLSFKPSLMAYCAIAEALDCAEFKGWIRFSDATMHGLLFETPRGSMAVVWSRKDGYILTKRAKPFKSPEPWVDTWKSKVHIALPAKTDATVLNCIGQGVKVPRTEDGTVMLELDGAARIVYGLDADKLTLW